MPADLDALAAALHDADAQHHADLHYLDTLDPQIVDAIGTAHQLPDPATDGLEGRCV